MLRASIWTSTESTSLHDSLVSEKTECLLPSNCLYVPYISSTDEVVKLEGYMLIYDSPTTISINTNGEFELYIDNAQVLKSSNTGTVKYYQTGILPFKCYIRPTSLPLKYEISPDQFVLNDGYIRIENPRSSSTKTIKLTFANPNEYIRQKFYIGNTELEVTYEERDTDHVKLTETTVNIPPEI